MMPLHRRKTHPEPVDGCFGCRVAGVGVQTQLIRQGADAVKKTPVVLDEGPRRGKVGGYHTEHWDDKVDAKVHAPQIRISQREV